MEKKLKEKSLYDQCNFEKNIEDYLIVKEQMNPDFFKKKEIQKISLIEKILYFVIYFGSIFFLITLPF